MEEKVFCRDCKSGEWTECATTDTPMRPLVVVYRQEGAGMPMERMIWCEVHKTYEYIEYFSGNHITTKAGCEMEGLPVELLQCERGRAREEAAIAPLYWRVCRKKGGGVFLALYTAEIVMLTQWDAQIGKRTPVPKARLGSFQGGSLQLLPDPKTPIVLNSMPSVPSAVADAAIEMLAEDAELRFGKRPVLPSYVHSGRFTDGRKRLTAFLNHPFHIALWLYAGQFLRGNMNYKRAVPKPGEDPFPYLAEALCLAPSKKLREQFEKNPCCLGTIAILRILGVQDEAFCEPFLDSWSIFGGLPSNILNEMGASPFRPPFKGEYTADVFADREALRALVSNQRGVYQAWDSLIFYCRWRLYRQGEKSLADHLLNMQKKWTPRLMNAVQVFHRCFLDMPEELLEKVLREGLTIDCHNQMICLANEELLGQRPFSYNDEEEGYECRIGEYTFRLIRDYAEFRAMASKVHNIGNWFNAPQLDDGTLRVSMHKHGQPIAIILLHGIARLFCAGSSGTSSEALVAAPTRIAYLRWMKWTGLYKKYEPFYAEDYEILSEDVHAEPLDKRPTRLREMLSMPQEAFRPGDYLRLYQMLEAANLEHFIMPPRQACDNEMDYLMQVFPYGEAIYRAAFGTKSEDSPYSPPGQDDLMRHVFPKWEEPVAQEAPKNREAAFVLSLLYGKGYPPILPKDEERAAYWKKQSEYEMKLK